MPNSQEIYEKLMAVTSIAHMQPQAVLPHLAQLVDLSLDLRQTQGLERALQLVEQLRNRELTAKQDTLLHYFVANAWANLKSVNRKGTSSSWDWHQTEAENEILHLRMAARSSGFSAIHQLRQCQVLTNLGNAFNHIGRFVEAIEHWDAALKINPKFGMALGNRARGLVYYASLFEHLCHQVPFLKQAYVDLTAALKVPLEPGASKVFQDTLERVKSRATTKRLEEPETELPEDSIGATKDEREYRRWCLSNRLFLNSMNDLGSRKAAGKDNLVMPSIVVPIDGGTLYLGPFNQMKQEFVSARYLFFEGITSEESHFSDRDVVLYDTLDFPSYSLAIEKTKMVFRTAYSLFDKIAFFLNHYLDLSIKERQVNFRTLWYSSQQKAKGLRTDFERRENWAMRGLFWLSKDIYEDKPGFRDAIEPDGQALSVIRNNIEHKYLKLHQLTPPQWLDDCPEILSSPFKDSLAYSLTRSDFEAKTLRLMKIGRAALIYLTAAVRIEERGRSHERGDAKIFPTNVRVLRDESKL